MLNTLIEFALARRWLVLAMALVLAGLGVRAYQQIPIDAFPDVSTTQVKLILKAPGMTPEEVEARITQPVETELLGIPNQTILRSLSKNALVDITVDFEEGTDIYWARQQVAERFANVKGDLPDNVSGGLAPISTPLSELFMFTIEGPLSLAEKRSLLDWTVRPQLRAIPGVADVNSLGGRVATFCRQPRPGRAGRARRHLRRIAHGAGNQHPQRRCRARQRRRGNLGGARQRRRRNSLDDLRHIGIRAVDGVVVTVGDVARVELGEMTRYGAVTQNGKGEAVEGLVIGLKGVNAGELIKNVKPSSPRFRRPCPRA